MPAESSSAYCASQRRCPDLKHKAMACSQSDPRGFAAVLRAALHGLQSCSTEAEEDLGRMTRQETPLNLGHSCVRQQPSVKQPLEDWEQTRSLASRQPAVNSTSKRQSEANSAPCSS
eukprot:TRINITY_DN99794_c0_g1_i1.p1 TRINITY_DN99794_c0_g1~~TRINITY_DN99794_c0_g1_i1.p1  ORF type:complete len:117 (+),score=18.10 TRINITY_DN99794_c0_g1_i1:47-397(+)